MKPQVTQLQLIGLNATLHPADIRKGCVQNDLKEWEAML